MNIIPGENDYIDIHSHSPETEKGIFRILNVMLNDPVPLPYGRPVSIGLHPWYVTDESFLILERTIERSIHLPEVKAIGETGLDRLCKSGMDLQEKAFISQIQIAGRINKPLIIHCVRAYSELMRLRKTFSAEISWIIHGFNGSVNIARQLVKNGFYLSFGSGLLKNKEKSREFAIQIPVRKIFIETDDAKIPLRVIYNEAAALYNMDVTSFLDRIRQNYSEAFKE